jgi:hypothetical protein
MKTEVEKRTGHCPTHGQVEGTREIPRLQFPFIVTWVMRAKARRKEPFYCPTCDEPLNTS